MPDEKYRETFGEGVEGWEGPPLNLGYNPTGDGQIHLTAWMDGEILESATYNLKIFDSPTLRGQFLNSVESALARRDGADAEVARQELNEWFADMAARLENENEAIREFLPPEIQQIIEGTESVEVRGGETTTWHVTLTFAGMTEEVELTAGDLVSDSGGALKEAIATKFYEVVEIGQDSWRAIRDEWQARKEVVAVVDETTADTIADRVLEFLGRDIIPVVSKEDMGNDVVAAWVDPTNEGGYADLDDPEAAVVWVQSSAVDDALEAAGKSLEHKTQLIKDLGRRDDLYGSRARRRWAWDTRTAVYPFVPDALGVDPEGFEAGTDDPNHSEVDP